MDRIRTLVVAVGAVVLMAACSQESTSGGDEAGQSLDLPDRVGEWQAVGDQVFDTESIYEYIDGHAEVYMAYGMVRCLSRRYEGPAGEAPIVLDLFELASDADAFGVFTHNRDGEVVEVGQGGLLNPGWLSFWKGRWYGSVYAEGEGDRVNEVLVAVAENAAQAIHDEGRIPALVSELPAEGLDQRSIRFLRTQEILNAVVYLGFGNVLEFGPDVAAVLGHYDLEGGDAWLLLADYPDDATASRAAAGATEAGLTIWKSNRRMATVLAPQPAAVADSLIEQLKGGSR